MLKRKLLKIEKSGKDKRKRLLVPKGLYRFSTFEEADAWWEKYCVQDVERTPWNFWKSFWKKLATFLRFGR